MTPSARAQAAIEVLDQVAAAARHRGAAADTIIQRYFAARRYAGSGDRRAVRELVFAVVRSVGDVPASGRAALIGYARAREPELLALFGDGPHGPAALVAGEAEARPGSTPGWMAPRLEAAFGRDVAAETAALLERAPLDLRVNTLKATRAEVAAALPDFVATPLSVTGLRGPNIAVEAHPLWQDGLIEVQDEGSQLVAAAAGARPGMTVVDLCAGAGGKTLALAADMAARGRLIATDTDRGRLAALPPRAVRAGAGNIETRLLDAPREGEQLADLAGRADMVLIDAPCSGSGTWRRNPEARWRLSADWLIELARAQDRLLDIAARLVAPGGRLVYAVCSVMPDEGPDRATAFLERYPAWQARPLPSPLAGNAALITPHRTGTDGFFIAAFGPIC